MCIFFTRRCILVFFVLGYLITFVGCRKDSQVTTIVGKTAHSDIVTWTDWYYKTYSTAPKLLLKQASQGVLNNRFFIRVPLENSRGMIYFTTTTSLQAVFIRANNYTDSIQGIKSMEFIV